VAIGGCEESVQRAAATAQRHGLHVMTRNVADFEITKVQVLNPWA
jgi:predicted nucleic acid-binding protein